ncbi:hypothetical protein EGH22_08050 [Halomicroarcula sp. F28]|uniref:hypothetical protein n=1 Tax=Haloarcula salinisoli TaxID=2487746 RepID=UPI001C73BD39|nr:hypothetical protein [Halomicroarcula salinisoli]MBX0286275.1 hypothetical protein [Halomicroarcula salinisoli]
MSSAEPPATGKQARVAALQWGLVQTFVLDTLARFLRNYYRATTTAFFPPDWVSSLQFATPLGLVVGAVGGYRWVTSGPGATTAAAHRDRVVFVGALLVGWALAIVPTLAAQWLLGEAFFTVPYFVIPTLSAISAALGAVAVTYRVDPAALRRRRARLLGAVQGAFVGLALGLVGFILYSNYLIATRDNFSVDGSPGIVLGVVVGALVGYALADRLRSGDRAAEFLVLFVCSLTVLSLGLSLGQTTLAAVGVPVGFGWSGASLGLSTVASLLLSGYLAYGAETAVYRRFVDG